MGEEPYILLEAHGFSSLEIAGLKWFLRKEGRVRVVSSDAGNESVEPSGSKGEATGESRCASLTTKRVRVSPDMLGPEPDEKRLMEFLSPWLSDEEDCGEQLSSREKEVLTLLASGLSNKEVADRLCISLNTAITHRRNLSSKLGIKSLAGLSLYAYLHELI